MPPTQISKLSAVAAEYLRNHDELEAAREMFRGERVKVLDALGQTMRDEAGKLNQVVSGARSAEKTGSFDIDVEREYVTVRAKEGKPRRSGYSAGLGAFLGHVGAQTLLWFHLKLTPGRIKKLELAALAKALGNAKVIDEGSWLYFRVMAQAAAELDLEALDESARGLPALFAIADAWIAKRWEE